KFHSSFTMSYIGARCTLFPYTTLFRSPVQSTVARGRVTEVDARAATALSGVLTVLTPFNAPRLQHGHDAELEVLQSDEVWFRGQIVAAVDAETPRGAAADAETCGPHGPAKYSP